MNVPGQIFDLLAQHKNLIYSGAGSVFCSLSDGEDAIGEGAMLSPSDPSYDADDVLRGIPSFTGIVYDPETGGFLSADQAELSVSQEDVTLGRPDEGWTGKLRNIDGTDLSFRVQTVMQDRTIGAYRLKLEILKATGTGRKIVRIGEGGI